MRQARAEFLPAMHDEELADAMREFRRIWDLRDRLNPGKLVGTQGDVFRMVVWEPQNREGTLENRPLFTQGTYGAMMHFCEHIIARTAPTDGSLEFAHEVMKVYEAALLSRESRIVIE